MNKEEIKEMLQEYISALREEIDIMMEHIEDLKNDIGFLRNCDTDCTCEVSDRIVNKILEYICR